MRARWLVSALTLFCLASVPFAIGAAATVNAEGDVAQEYIEIENTGTEVIRCFRADFPVEVESVSSPAGWAAGYNPNNPKQIGGQTINPAQGGIPPNGKLRFPVKFKEKFPAGTSGDLYVSSTCQTGSDVKVRWFGPAGPCSCKDVVISTAVGNYTASRVHNIPVKWTLVCEGEPGSCKGEIKVAAPAGTNVKITQPAKGKNISCLGKCPRKNTGTFHVIARGNDLDLKERRGKTFKYSFTGYCVEGKQRVQVSKATMTVVYDARGFTDRKKSDLNANGKADSKDK